MSEDTLNPNPTVLQAHDNIGQEVHEIKEQMQQLTNFLMENKKGKKIAKNLEDVIYPHGFTPANPQQTQGTYIYNVPPLGGLPSEARLYHHPTENFKDRPFDSETRKPWEILEERLQSIEGVNIYGNTKATDLCLVQDVVIPPKFKVPDFDKYEGTSCPQNHLIMYCRKMAAYAHDEKLLIHFFQNSLTGASARWYMQLDRSHVSSWKDLANAFVKHYRYNIDMAPDRMELQSMEKKSSESFKQYSQRWRELAAQVQPPLSDKEMVATFINTLQTPYYDHIIGNTSTNFADIVIIGERIEDGVKKGRIASSPAEGSSGKQNSPKKDEVQVVSHISEPAWKSHHSPMPFYPPHYPPPHSPNQNHDPRINYIHQTPLYDQRPHLQINHSNQITYPHHYPIQYINQFIPRPPPHTTQPSTYPGHQQINIQCSRNGPVRSNSNAIYRAATSPASKH